MDHHEEAICLARTANGFVKICPPGCTHVTFGGMTFNFDTPSKFQGVAVVFPGQLSQLVEGQNFRFEHEGIIIELPFSDAHEFGLLITEAAATIAWSSGEMEFTDDDFQQILKRLSL